MPETEIVCHEEVKNSTYMNNVNTVDLTVADYTGMVTVKAVCKRGGLFTAGAEQTVQAEAGKRVRLPEKIVFVPEEAGEVSYVIEVYLPDGTKIGQTEVANTITATRLVPTIRVYYANPFYQGQQTDTQSWYGYNTVEAQVTFTPQLDYPEPLYEKQLLEITLKPQYCFSYELVWTYDPYWGDRNGVELANFYPSRLPDFHTIEVSYPRSDYTSYELVATGDFPRDTNSAKVSVSALFAPYTRGENRLLMTNSGTFNPSAVRSYFIYYEFGNINELRLKISQIYEDNDLEFMTDIRFINVVNEIDSKI